MPKFKIITLELIESECTYEIEAPDRRTAVNAAHYRDVQPVSIKSTGGKDKYIGVISVKQEATVPCEICGQPVPVSTSHLHGDGYIGDACCWDERLRSSE